MTKRLIITADDYGYHPSYDAGILEAVQAGAVDAVGVMVGRLENAPARLVDSGAALGVHLERGEPVAGQIERFERLLGRGPDFLDGHRHCHAGPALRAAVADLAAALELPVRSVDAGHRRLLRERGVRTPDLLIGRLDEGEPARPAELDSLPDGWSEWMVHPGRADPASGSSYDAGREEDLRTLLGLELPAGVERRDHRQLPAWRPR